jgi:hypothetical protein
MSICKDCFHSYVCEQFNEHRECGNKKCHFYNNHFVSTTDVVKVVRCRDCKSCDIYYPKKAKGEEPEIAYYCNLLEYPTEPTHYCGYGELKEREGK